MHWLANKGFGVCGGRQLGEVANVVGGRGVEVVTTRVCASRAPNIDKWVENSLPGCQGVDLLRSEIPEQSLRPTNPVQS